MFGVQRQETACCRGQDWREYKRPGWGYRKYEYEYRFAKKLGALIGRKMKQERTRIIRLSVSNKHYYRLFMDGSYSTENVCFLKELGIAWSETQRHRPEIDNVYDYELEITLMDGCIMFIDSHGLPLEVRRCAGDLTNALKTLTDEMK